MKITVESLCIGQSDDITVCFELAHGDNICKEKFVISAEAYARLGLRKGESEQSVYDSVEKEAKVYSAFKKGTYVLGFGACSKNQLVSKLRSKGFDLSVANEAVERISLRGFLDENENAKREAERCCAKLWGESRIRAKLFEKRYCKDAVEQAMFFLEDSGVDFDANCKLFIDKHYRDIPRESKELQKLVAAVCRQGYSVSQVKSACLLLTKERKISRIFE